MIDLDNNTRLILFTLVLQQAGHVPTSFFIETARPPASITIGCSRCERLFAAPAYSGRPAMNLAADYVLVLGADVPEVASVPPCSAAPSVAMNVAAFVSHVAELPCTTPCEPGDPCLPCWARGLTRGTTEGLSPNSLAFVNAWRTLHGKPRVASIAEHEAEAAKR